MVLVKSIFKPVFHIGKNNIFYEAEFTIRFAILIYICAVLFSVVKHIYGNDFWEKENGWHHL